MAGFVPSSGWAVTGQQSGPARVANVPRERAGGTGTGGPLEALTRAASLSWHTIRDRRPLALQGAGQGPCRQSSHCDGKSRLLEESKCRLGGKGRSRLVGFVASRCLDPLSRAPTARQASTRGVVWWANRVLWVSKQTDVLPPHCSAFPQRTFPRRHCAVYCILQYVIWEGGQWISCIIPRKLQFMGWMKADLTQRKHLDAPGLPTPHFLPAPWQLIQRGFCIALRFKTIASHCSGGSKRLLLASLFQCLSVPVSQCSPLSHTEGASILKRLKSDNLPLHGSAKTAIPRWGDGRDGKDPAVVTLFRWHLQGSSFNLFVFPPFMQPCAPRDSMGAHAEQAHSRGVMLALAPSSNGFEKMTHDAHRSQSCPRFTTSS